MPDLPGPGSGDGLPPGLARLNALPHDEAVAVLLGCCSARRWAEHVARGRPYQALGELLAAAGVAWAGRGPGDLDEAMAGHPRIGERAVALSQQSRQEQSGVGAAARTLTALAEANAAYEGRFGHIFLISAAGRGPQEILAEISRRMGNSPAAERDEAAAQIGKINALRLRKLAGS